MQVTFILKSQAERRAVDTGVFDETPLGAQETAHDSTRFSDYIQLGGSDQAGSVEPLELPVGEHDGADPDGDIARKYTPDMNLAGPTVSPVPECQSFGYAKFAEIRVVLDPAQSELYLNRLMWW